MMITVCELREKCKKSNIANLPWFSANVVQRFSIYLTWLFVNLHISGNQVLVISSIIELTGALLFLTKIKTMALIGAFLLFLGYVLDHVDGEVRRYRNESRAWGIYLDRIMHRIIYPLTYLTIGINVYFVQGKIQLLFLAISAAFFNELIYFNKLFKTTILGSSSDTPTITVTKSIRNGLEVSLGRKNFLFISILCLKRIYDHIYCNWVQYIGLIILISLNKLHLFVFFYGVAEPLKWVLETFLDIKYKYLPYKKRFSND